MYKSFLLSEKHLAVQREKEYRTNHVSYARLQSFSRFYRSDSVIDYCLHKRSNGSQLFGGGEGSHWDQSE